MRWPEIKNPIRGFAVLCVAVIAGYVMWMGYRLNETLSGPGWCRTALGAEKSSPAAEGTITGLTSCVGLLTIQLRSLATNSHILFGVVALCLLTLIVIVIAGGKVSFNVSRTGAAANIGKDVESLPVTVVNEKNDPVPVESPQSQKFTPPPGETL